MHALWTLEGLGALDAALVREKLKDEHPQVRATAIRVSESLFKAGDKSLAADVQAMTKDKDADVYAYVAQSFEAAAAEFTPSIQRCAVSRGATIQTNIPKYSHVLLPAR